MIWIIDDEPEILKLMEFIFKDIGWKNLKICRHFEECKPQKGDIVVHDIVGVGNVKKERGVLYFSHSGSIDPNDFVDFRKPCDIYKLAETMINLHEGDLIYEID